MLDATTSASDGDSETPVAAPVSPVGPRSGRKKKRGLFHRTGVVVPALAMAMLLVVGVLVAARMLNTSGSGAFSPTDLIFQFGLTGDKPVVGFWTLP